MSSAIQRFQASEILLTIFFGHAASGGRFLHGAHRGVPQSQLAREIDDGTTDERALSFGRRTRRTAEQAPGTLGHALRHRRRQTLSGPLRQAERALSFRFASNRREALHIEIANKT